MRCALPQMTSQPYSVKVVGISKNYSSSDEEIHCKHYNSNDNERLLLSLVSLVG